MSEPKRVNFSTISNTISASTAAARFGSDFLTAPDKINNTGSASTSKAAAASNSGGKTIRLKLELFQTDSCSYPEFNYSKLLHLEKKKLKKLKQKNGLPADPFAENDDDVARIAEELERKYGSTYGSGRGRSKKDDHCDIGLGYDESDSFIDNTEAYDEVIPEEVETIEGGFYINCGALEFKKLHESTTTRTDEIIKMPNRPKKRVLSSSSEDSSSTDDASPAINDDEAEVDGDDDDDEEENENESSEETGAESGKVKSTNAEKRLKTSAATTTAPSTTNATVKKTQENGKKKSKTIGLSFSSSNSPKPTTVGGEEQGSDSDKERMRQKTVKTTTVKDMLKAKRDSFLKMQFDSDTAKMGNGEVKGATSKSSENGTSSDDSDDSSDNSDSNQSAPQDKADKSKKSATAVGTTSNEENSEKLRSIDTKLPALEPDVMASINEFKEFVKSKCITGKKFLFDDNLTEVFLKIDESLLCIDKTQRNMVFAHLEYHLLLPKYYFLRKAKQLRIKEEKLKSKRALGKLRKAVIETMPGAISTYEVELRKYAELQSDNLNSEQHPPRMPKKKFPWNSNLRNLLYDVYQVRWTSYPVLGTRKETLEDFINVYMKDKVVELWPNGWMRYEELQKEIEKRKAIVKKQKDKEKKKATATITTAPTTANNNTNNTDAVQKTQNAPGTSTIASAIMNTSFIKQFEDFAASSRSCANSDTDSVASSSASSSLKRKNSEANRQSKSKTQKTSAATTTAKTTTTTMSAIEQQQLQLQQQLNFEQQVSAAINSNSAAITVTPLDLMISPTRRTDHSINTIIASATSPTSSNCNATATAATTVIKATKHSTNAAAVAAPATKPTTTAHIIDLDNYKSTSDILQTSKQLMHAAATAAAAAAATNNAERRGSGSESDGVEIVGVFPAKTPPSIVATTKQTKHKRNASCAAGGTQNNRNTATTSIAGFHMTAVSSANLFAARSNSLSNITTSSTLTKTTNNAGSGSRKSAGQLGNVTRDFDNINMLQQLQQATKALQNPPNNSSSSSSNNKPQNASATKDAAHNQ